MIPKLNFDTSNSTRTTISNIITPTYPVSGDINNGSLQLFLVLFFVISLLILLILFALRVRSIIVQKKHQQQSWSDVPYTVEIQQEHLSMETTSSPTVTLFHLLMELDRSQGESSQMPNSPANRSWEMLSRLRQEWLLRTAVSQTGSSQHVIDDDLSSYLALHRCHLSSPELTEPTVSPPTYAEVIREKQHEQPPPSYQEVRRQLPDEVDSNYQTTEL